MKWGRRGGAPCSGVLGEALLKRQLGVLAVAVFLQLVLCACAHKGAPADRALRKGSSGSLSASAGWAVVPACPPPPPHTHTHTHPVAAALTMMLLAAWLSLSCDAPPLAAFSFSSLRARAVAAFAPLPPPMAACLGGVWRACAAQGGEGRAVGAAALARRRAAAPRGPSPPPPPLTQPLQHLRTPRAPSARPWPAAAQRHSRPLKLPPRACPLPRPPLPSVACTALPGAHARAAHARDHLHWGTA